MKKIKTLVNKKTVSLLNLQTLCVCLSVCVCVRERVSVKETGLLRKTEEDVTDCTWPGQFVVELHLKGQS